VISACSRSEDRPKCMRRSLASCACSRAICCCRSLRSPDGAQSSPPVPRAPSQHSAPAPVPSMRTGTNVAGGTALAPMTLA
jgi:hypothetical protein